MAATLNPYTAGHYILRRFLVMALSFYHSLHFFFLALSQTSTWGFGLRVDFKSISPESSHFSICPGPYSDSQAYALSHAQILAIIAFTNAAHLKIVKSVIATTQIKISTLYAHFWNMTYRIAPVRNLRHLIFFHD